MRSKQLWALLAVCIVLALWYTHAGSASPSQGAAERKVQEQLQQQHWGQLQQQAYPDSTGTNKCPCDSPPRRMWIAMTSWNDSAGLRRSLRNLIWHQHLRPGLELNIVVFEDQSDDVLSYADQVDFSDLVRMSNHLVTFLPKPSSSVGAAAGKWALFEYIRRHALPHEYCLVMDGDDVLADGQSLQDVDRWLSSAKVRPWFAWGRINGKFQEQCGPLKFDGKTLRTSTWSFCHPRVFSAHLLQHIEASDFQRDDGTWLQKATDRPFIFGFMELAGADRTLFMGERAVYNYTFNQNNGLKRFQPEVIMRDKELVNERKPLSKLKWECCEDKSRGTGRRIP